MPRGPNKEKRKWSGAKHLVRWDSQAVQRYFFKERAVTRPLNETLVYYLCQLGNVPCPLIDPDVKIYVDQWPWATGFIRDERAPQELVKRGWAERGRSKSSMNYGRNYFRLTASGLEVAEYASKHGKLPPSPVTPRSERRERQPYTRF